MTQNKERRLKTARKLLLKGHPVKLAAVLAGVAEKEVRDLLKKLERGEQ